MSTMLIEQIRLLGFISLIGDYLLMQRADLRVYNPESTTPPCRVTLRRSWASTPLGKYVRKYIRRQLLPLNTNLPFQFRLIFYSHQKTYNQNKSISQCRPCSPPPAAWSQATTTKETRSTSTTSKSNRSRRVSTAISLCSTKPTSFRRPTMAGRIRLSNRQSRWRMTRGW